MPLLSDLGDEVLGRMRSSGTRWWSGAEELGQNLEYWLSYLASDNRG